MIVVQRAPAYATIQDEGRRGFFASGVPRAGAMDLCALSTLNALLGNNRGAAAIECGLTGGELMFERSLTFAIGGAAAAARLDGESLEAYRAYQAAEGAILSVERFSEGRFLYVACVGGVDCQPVMGSRSTYLPGEFGGLDGRRIKSGDRIPVGKPHQRRRHQVSDALPEGLRPPLQLKSFRYLPRDYDTAGIGHEALAGRYRISAASDRTGYRLEGPPPADGASVTSEPVCAGVIQLPPGGEAIILMADAPTIGGYRIVGTVISADLGALAQRLPGEEITLAPITVERAQRELELRADIEARVREWSLG